MSSIMFFHFRTISNFTVNTHFMNRKVPERQNMLIALGGADNIAERCP
jgi:hypothetical protein